MLYDENFDYFKFSTLLYSNFAYAPLHCTGVLVLEVKLSHNSMSINVFYATIQYATSRAIHTMKRELQMIQSRIDIFSLVSF
jgi:hypothetical protein